MRLRDSDSIALNVEALGLHGLQPSRVPESAYKYHSVENEYFVGVV